MAKAKCRSAGFFYLSVSYLIYQQTGGLKINGSKTYRGAQRKIYSKSSGRNLLLMPAFSGHFYIQEFSIGELSYYIKKPQHREVSPYRDLITLLTYYIFSILLSTYNGVLAMDACVPLPAHGYKSDKHY